MIADYSEVCAGRTARLFKLDEALAFGKYEEALKLAEVDARDAEHLSAWIAAKLAGTLK